MTSFTNTAQERSRLYQLIALGFVHPVVEFHQRLVDGSYPQALKSNAHLALDIEPMISQPQISFEDYEAEYISTFHVGQDGQPRVYLNAGHHEELSGDMSHPEILLDYVGWYKHFGLKTNSDELASELPDHIACQFEFLTWLSHLEHTAIDNPELLRGYQSAQRDFCQRHLSPFVELLLAAIQRESRKVPASPFYLELITLSSEVIIQTLAQLLVVVGEAEIQSSHAKQMSSVNPGNQVL